MASDVCFISCAMSPLRCSMAPACYACLMNNLRFYICPHLYHSKALCALDDKEVRDMHEVVMA